MLANSPVVLPHRQNIFHQRATPKLLPCPTNKNFYRMVARQILVSVLFCVSITVQAQQPYTLPVNIQAAFTKQTRDASGQPGKNYWQNAADYDLHIHFDPETRLLEGVETIVYTNNSTDTLRQLVFKLYPNLYKKGSTRLMPVSADDLTDGVSIDSMQVNGTLIAQAQLRTGGTNMFTRLANPLVPGQHLQCHIRWHYTLNKKSHIRTGEIDAGADFVAYFFPRIAVYDDIDGWNMFPYNGMLEFYNDFCHFKTAITVPNNQVVWATGNLLNGKEVLAEKNYARLTDAGVNDAVVYVIDSTDLAQNAYTNHDHPYNTWVYEADSVTDFAFACSDHYLWHSTSLVVDPATGRRTRVDAAYNPMHKDYYTVINDARKTVEAMSYRFPAWPYPNRMKAYLTGLTRWNTR
jgi:hypothetical protein